MASSRASSARAAVDVTFEELYRGHHADVFRDALRELGNVHDAEDVTQAAFVDAYRAVLRGTRPQAPRAWLLAIAENVRRRRFRTAQRRPRELPFDEDLPLAADLPHEQAEALVEALAELPPEQRRAFVLREIAGHSYDEIAAEVDSSVASVQMLLFRARRSLREQLEPPVVAQRRTGLLVPVPGWLASLASKVELAGLTPRVAGATGATALVVFGAGVGVPKAPADISLPPRVAAQPPVAAGMSAGVTHSSSRPAARAVVSRPGGPALRPSLRVQKAKIANAAPTLAPAAGEPEPGSPASQPASAQPASAQPAVTASPTVASAPAVDAERVGNALSAPVQVVEETLAPVLTPVVSGVLPQPPVQPSVPLSATPAPPPAVVDVVDVAAGAAGAAGAGAPPLPVPALPPVALPPTP